MNRMLEISKFEGLIQINDTIIYSLIRMTYTWHMLAHESIWIFIIL